MIFPHFHCYLTKSCSCLHAFPLRSARYLRILALSDLFRSSDQPSGGFYRQNNNMFVASLQYFYFQAQIGE